MPEEATAKHFQRHVSEVPPAGVRADAGWQGVDIRWLVSSETAGSKELCFWRTVFPPGAAHTRHIHPNAAEALFVIRGRGAAGTEDEEHEVGAGTAVYVPKGVVHWFRNVGDEEINRPIVLPCDLQRCGVAGFEQKCIYSSFECNTHQLADNLLVIDDQNGYGHTSSLFPNESET